MSLPVGQDGSCAARAGGGDLSASAKRMLVVLQAGARKRLIGENVQPYHEGDLQRESHGCAKLSPSPLIHTPPFRALAVLVRRACCALEINAVCLV